MRIFLCSHLVTLHWGAHEAVANLERISESLATINFEQPLPIGATVTLTAGNSELRGTVERCACEMSGHEIDIVLDPPWSLAAFVPNHLFDPDRMIPK